MARLASRRHRPAPASVEPAGTPADEVYVRGIIEFIDKRWTRAEGDLPTALRSLLLLGATTAGLVVLIASLAAAVAGVGFLLLVAQDRFLAARAVPSGLALLAAAGIGLLLLLLRGRSRYLRRRRRSRDR